MVSLVQDRLLLGVGLTGTIVDASHAVELSQRERDPRTGQLLPVQAAEHLLDLTLFDVDLSASLAVSKRAAIELRLPLRTVNVDALFTDAGGNVLANYESIHHRQETLFGPGDVELSMRLRALAPEHAGEGPTIDVLLGLSLPTGDIEPNPYELGARGETHQHIFFSSGTIDPMLGLDIHVPIAPGYTFHGLLNGRASLYRNVYGLRRGAKGLIGAKMAADFGSETWVLRVGPELYHEQPDTWRTGEASQNSGRTDLIAALGVTWKVTRRLALDFDLRRPFVLHSEGGQLEIPLTLSLAAHQVWDL